MILIGLLRFNKAKKIKNKKILKKKEIKKIKNKRKIRKKKKKVKRMTIYKNHTMQVVLLNLLNISQQIVRKL